MIGSRGGQDRTTTPYSRGPRPTSSENLMLTGDENIVDIEFAVLWQIKDVFKYVFDVRNPEENVRSGAEAAMREVIGKSNLQYAQTEGRSRIEQDTKEPAAAHSRRIRLGRARSRRSSSCGSIRPRR